jgi:hypothetical protein
MTERWVQALWEELAELGPLQQIVTAGEWITLITQEILPALGDRRREMIVEVLDQPGMDHTTVAELIGSRRTAIKRLAEEGRAKRRQTKQPV